MRVRLAVAPADGWPQPLPPLWTSNVSPGGMYLEAPRPAADLAPGAILSFQLTVPPGQGHSIAPCAIRGKGQVVRTAPAGPGLIGLAVRFTQPLALEL